METLIRAAALSHFFEVAHSLGLNPQPLLRRVGLSRAMLQDPDRRVPAAAVVALLEASAQASGCLTFGLRMAETRQLSDFGAMSLLIGQQPTLRAALATLIRYRHLVNDSIALLLEDVGKTVVIRHELVSAPGSRQATELAIGVLARLGSALLGARWQPVSVNFTHAAPADLRAHRRLFACPLVFNSEFNGIVCLAADLDAPNPGADPVMARYAQRFVDALPAPGGGAIGHEVRAAIYLLLPMGRATSAAVAQGLGLSLRTMQRQLDEAGETFTGILDEVRRELARRYVENPQYSLTRVSGLLGYGSPAAFSRWFSARFGMAPVVWRKQAGGRAG